MRWSLAAVVLWAGCAQESSSDPARSVPIAPTVELASSEEEALNWVDIEGFVTSDSPSMPDYAQPLRLGMTEAETRQVLEQLVEPRIRPSPEVELSGYRVLSVPLKANREVGLTAIIEVETDRLDQIDLSVPSAQTMHLLTEAWGTPSIVSHPELGPVASWRGEGLWFELTRAPDPGRSVLKVRADESGAQGP